MATDKITEDLKKHFLSETKKYRSASSANISSKEEKKIARDLAYLVRKFQSIDGTKNVAMKKHLDGIATTKGDYSRRNPRVINKVEYMIGFCRDLMTNEPELENTIIGLMIRTWEILHTPQFIGVSRKAYENNNPKSAYTAGTFYSVMYTCFVLFLETSTMYLIPYEFRFAHGLEPMKIADDFHNEHKAFVKSVVYGVASLLIYVENQKNLATVAIQAIDDEKKRITESKEGFPILIPILIGVGAVLSLFLIRSMFYWFANFKVDVAHQLEFESELLLNNIRLLKEALKHESDPEKRKKIEETIKKQEVWVNKFDKFAKNTLKDETEASYDTQDQLDTEESTDPTKEETGQPEIFL